MRGICIVFVLLLSLSLDMVNGKGLIKYVTFDSQAAAYAHRSSHQNA